MKLLRVGYNIPDGDIGLQEKRNKSIAWVIFIATILNLLILSLLWQKYFTYYKVRTLIGIVYYIPLLYLSIKILRQRGNSQQRATLILFWIITSWYIVKGIYNITTLGNWLLVDALILVGYFYFFYLMVVKITRKKLIWANILLLPVIICVALVLSKYSQTSFPTRANTFVTGPLQKYSCDNGEKFTLELTSSYEIKLTSDANGTIVLSRESESNDKFIVYGNDKNAITFTSGYGKQVIKTQRGADPISTMCVYD